MALIRWNPRRDIIGFNEAMDRMFDNFFGFNWPRTEADNSLWTPRVNIEDEDGRYILTAEVPGMEKEGINIEVKDHVLTLTGENKMEEEKKEKNFHLFERCYGQFARTFRLPENVDTEGIAAEYKNGILKIDIPKTEEAKPKEIKVKVN